MFTTTETAPPQDMRHQTRGEDRREQGDAATTRGPLALLTDPAWIALMLWRRKGLILLMAVLGAILAALASLTITPKYVSTAQLFIDPRDLRVLQNEVSPNSTGGDPTSITGYLESQARIIASDSIKLSVIHSEGLTADPEFGGERPRSGLSAWWSGLFPKSGAAEDRSLYALAALDKAVTIRRSDRTFVIDISASAEDPRKAARIANALASAYLEDQASVRADVANRATAALTSRLEELRNRLRQAEQKAEAYKEKNSLVGLGTGRSLGEEQLALNTQQLVTLRTRTAEARAKYEQAVAARTAGIETGAVPEAVGSATITALRAQLGAALAREADLAASLGGRHPALAAAQSQVRDARRQIGEELARITRAAKVEYDRAVDAERELARRVDQITSTQYVAGRASVELRELEREVESNRVIYDAFLRRARETGELAGIDTTNARVISVAMPPLQRSGISRRTLAMLGGFGGGATGAFLALGLALMAATRRPAVPVDGETIPAPPSAEATPAPAPGSATVPAIVETKPAVAAPTGPAKGGWRRFVSIPGGAGEKKPEALATAETPLLATLPAVRHRRWRRQDGETRSVFQAKTHLVDVLDKPGGAFAKAVKELAQTLAASGPGPRRILVTALRPQAGGSTVALNLALDAAVSGLPALLIDAGQGTGSLSSVYAGEAETGLGDVAAGSSGLVRAALQDEGTGLFFLPRHGAVDAISAAQIERNLFAAARRFGPIIIDGSALGRDALTQRFAETVDDIVLVVREGAVSAKDIEAGHAALGAQASKLRGFVVSGI